MNKKLILVYKASVKLEKAIEIEHREKFLLEDCPKNEMSELKKRMARITSEVEKAKWSSLFVTGNIRKYVIQ